jgi:outer membrane protein assembly factor BamA
VRTSRARARIRLRHGEGARVELSWEHRNLLPPEGAVRFRGVLGTEEQLIGATLRRNNFGRRDRVLTANVVASNIDRDAYNARTFLIGGGIERQTNIIWQKRWTWSIGADLIASDERDVNIDLGMSRRRTFFIAALPGTLSYDGSNDLLDPTRGYRLAGRISPELSLQSGTFGYTRAQIDGSFYQPVSDTVTLAARARLGTIFGAGRDRIAPSRRFYAGGGGSVRGYGFQRLGPARSGVRRSDRRPQPRGIRAGSAGAGRWAVRGGAVHRCGQYLHLPIAASGQASLWGRHRRPLSQQFRADPRGCRDSAQPPQRRPARRGLRFARSGLLSPCDDLRPLTRSA